MRLPKQDGHSISFMYGFGFPIHLNLAGPIHDVINLLDTGMVVQSLGSSRRNQKMVHVSPVGLKYIGIEGTPVLDGSLTAMITRNRLQQRPVKPHQHELRNLILGCYLVAGVAKVKRIVVAL